MIPHDSEIPEDLFSSHVWNKCKLMLLVYYYRDKTVEPLQRRIRYVRLFEIPEEDLPIIEEDYRTIAKLIREGRADELSEGMTAYLGACTKGRTAATMQAKQFYPYIHEDGREEYRTAKRRAFSLKQSYMDYILHHYMADDHSPLDFDFSSRPEAVEVDSSPHGRKADGKAPTFEESVINALDRYVGMDATELMRAFNVKNATGGEAKNRYASLACHMLGYTSNKALALEKAGISVRAIRARANWSVKESLSLDTFEFSGLLDEPSWEESKLFEYLDSTKFLFLVFHGEPGAMRFAGACFWHMSARELQQDVRRCWEDTKYTILNGVEWSEKRRRNGSAIHNNLPGKSDNPICHVRPHANRRGYIYADGRQIGEKKDMSELPDGRWMTRQSFWINNDYLANLAILMDSFSWLRDLIYPMMVVVQTIPTIAIAPILVLWLGYGILPKIVLIILTTTFPIIISILDGFRNLDPDVLTLFQLMHANRRQLLWHYKIPASLPYFYAGLRVSVSYAFVTTVVSEWLGGFEGLGVYIIQSKKLFQYDTMFAIIILISVISLLGMKVVDLHEAHTLKWRASN